MELNVKTKTRAFTLVELLVVISIIALLLAMLMPALSKAREQARNVVDKAQLHSWGLAFGNYAAENGDKVCPSLARVNGAVVTWDIILKKYYVDDKIRFCPSASRVLSGSIIVGNTNPVSYIGSQFGAWSVVNIPSTLPNVTGSYCMNLYAQTPPDASLLSVWRLNPASCWGSTAVKGASSIPLLGDGIWREVTVGPTDDARPKLPIVSWEQAVAWGGIGAYLIERHGKGINLVFLDSSVKNVSLQNLFKLSWSRDYIPKEPTRRSWMH